MCTPQTGSRTSRRERRPDCCGAAGALGFAVRVFINPRSSHTTTRRNIATVQHSTTSQIKNRIIREKNSKLLILPAAIVCKGKRQSQTKSSDFNSLRGEEMGPGKVISRQFKIKAINISKIEGFGAIGIAMGLNFSNHGSTAGIRSVPMYGRKTSGMMIEPSAC